MRGDAETAVCAMTYNIRQCLGMDRVRKPDRILRVVNRAEADIIALQEVSDPPGATVVDRPFDLFRRETGFHAVAAPTFGSGASAYGNLLLSRWPIVESQAIDLSVPGREPRNAIRAVIKSSVGRFRVIATHLGLSLGERRIQTDALVTMVAEDLEIPTILLGDLNEWRWRARSPRKLLEHLRPPAEIPPTFPSRWPVLPLDQVWLRRNQGPFRVRVPRTADSRIASDHLPVIADIRLRHQTG